jgi:organic radical activating enzyme
MDTLIMPLETQQLSNARKILPAPFSDPQVTAKGERRAVVPFDGLDTLWFNTGTLCNIACTDCYIESSPRNDALVHLTRAEVAAYLDEAVAGRKAPPTIGFTGGEPFMNPAIMGMLEDSVTRGYHVLVLTNAMKPLQHHQQALLDLNARYPSRVSLRVSLDHYDAEQHELIRGPRTWQPAIDGLKWLTTNGFDVALAGRKLWNETDAELRAGYHRTLSALGMDIDVQDPARLVLFPEMDEAAHVPEISDGCWAILKKAPSSVMCASSRMVIKRKGASAPSVVSCTLLPYDPAFELGRTLAEADCAVSLTHRHCAKFCVLGGASCSTGT